MGSYEEIPEPNPPLNFKGRCVSGDAGSCLG